MEEERRRMREHVMKEVDKDGDGIVSLAEFVGYTQTEEFANPDEDSYKVCRQNLFQKRFAWLEPIVFVTYFTWWLTQKAQIRLAFSLSIQ